MPATVEAHDNYLQGQFFYHRRAPGDLERSARYYEDAIAMDPGYARAWAALSGAYSLLRRDDPQNARLLLDKQGLAALKAVELDPDLAVAHARLASYYYVGNDVRAGNHHLERAAALEPDDLLVLGAEASNAMYRGNFDAAIDAWRRSIVQDPLAPTARINLATTLAVAGHPDQALAEYRRVLDLSPDIGWEIQLDVVRLLILLRRFDEAQRELARISEGRARDYGLAMLYELPARRAEAAAALERLAATEANNSRDAVWLADVYCYRGMHEQAFAVLQARKETIARDQHFSAEKAWTFREDLRLSPFLKRLHDDPRWQELQAP
jgi:tetratricopeptide (TPR) repeat protein